MDKRTALAEVTAEDDRKNLDSLVGEVLASRVDGGALERKPLGIDAALVDNSLARQGLVGHTADLWGMSFKPAEGGSKSIPLECKCNRDLGAVLGNLHEL